MSSKTILRTTDNDQDERLRARRAARFEARSWLWRHSKLVRVRSCGRGVRKDADVTVKVTTHDDGSRTAGYGGVQSCGSVWACPVCSAKIANGRQQDIAAALEGWHKRGGRVALVTLTMRHRKGQRLSDLWSALSPAWHAATSGRGWDLDQATSGTCMALGRGKARSRIPVIRVVEATHGDNGWHLHVHALLLLGSAVSEDHVSALGGSMFARWSAALVRRGMHAPSAAHGVDARLLRGDAAAPLSDYFTKAVYSASMETARADLKTARFGNRTPFGILGDLLATYRDGGAMPATATAADADLWAEWERGSKGRRQVTWSHGLRQLLALGVDRTDEDLAEDDTLAGEVVAVIDPESWARIVSAEAQLPILLAFEVSLAAGRALLDSYRRGRPRSRGGPGAP